MQTRVFELRWDESMRTGDDTADAQHRELIRQVNLLMAAMSRSEAASQLEPLLKFLADYVVRHFKHEESCMEKFHCPATEINKAAHAEFLKKFASFREQLATHSQGESLIASQLLHELSDWLVNHIRRVDSQLLPYAKKAA